jgi:sulfur-oxidizing protein SoxB
VFTPYVLREVNGATIAIVGQAFPVHPDRQSALLRIGVDLRHPGRRAAEAHRRGRAKGAQAVVLLSHNGMDVDLKLASRVTGIDAILGGHTHDAVPRPVEVKNPAGTTLVTNAGCNGKFLGYSTSTCATASCAE